MAQTLREMIRQHEYYHAGTSKGLDNIEFEAAIRAWAKELVASVDLWKDSAEKDLNDKIDAA